MPGKRLVIIYALLKKRGILRRHVAGIQKIAAEFSSADQSINLSAYYPFLVNPFQILFGHSCELGVDAEFPGRNFRFKKGGFLYGNFMHGFGICSVFPPAVYHHQDIFFTRNFECGNAVQSLEDFFPSAYEYRLLLEIDTGVLITFPVSVYLDQQHFPLGEIPGE